MSNNQMVTNAVKMEIAETPAQAPNYGAAHTRLVIKNCIIVKGGTLSGKPTVDLQLEDENGDKFIVMATGGILQMVSAEVEAIAGNY